MTFSNQHLEAEVFFLYSYKLLLVPLVCFSVYSTRSCCMVVWYIPCSCKTLIHEIMSVRLIFWICALIIWKTFNIKLYVFNNKSKIITHFNFMFTLELAYKFQLSSYRLYATGLFGKSRNSFGRVVILEEW
jgi:hypothetical protein